MTDEMAVDCFGESMHNDALDELEGEFHDQQKGNRAIYIIPIIIGVGLGFSFILMGAFKAILWLIPLLTILVYSLYLFSRLKIKCTNQELSFKMGWVGKKVPLNDIQYIFADEISPFGEFGGYGVKRVPGKKVGYMMRKGKGVRMKIQSGKRYAITMNRPDDLVRFIIHNRPDLKPISDPGIWKS